MGKLKLVKGIPNNVKLSLDVELNLEGLTIISYLDEVGKEQEEASRTDFTFEEIKDTLLNSYIIPEKGWNHENAVKEGKYILPEKDFATDEVVAEITRMKEFFIDLESECFKNIK